ncbi:MAG TPA: hypothetical protein VKS44_13250 [Candidatus Acidoferrales bacterium]|nr:hypothetical protein [Candidatus Acidoferrales bacterium]
MMRSRTVFAVLATLALLFVAALGVRAQEEMSGKKKTPDVLANLKFRNLGPASAGGRVTSVVGVPGNPSVYYVGAAGGGVFKSVDGGLTWKAIFEHESTASIGAIALAPSNPNFVWVGTGEGNIRNDLVDGHGVYFSPDAGRSWKFMGLAETQHISAIAVAPGDPNTVFVGAMGHAWAPNAERGVFKTTDGGKTWKKVLFVNDTTGVSDLALDAGNPEVIFAGMWQFRRYPWNLVDGGPGSGLYRSTDGGETWEKLTKGLPEGPLGRIAVAVAPSDPDHVYALIGAKKGMLWQSVDMGDTWTPVSDNHALDVRSFYFSKMLVAPHEEDKVFFMSFNLMESDDGGKTAHVADRGVHSDHHALWIDPKDPKRMIQGGDGGVFLSMDGSKTWRFLDGLPIEQLYQVAVDSRSPYDVCGGLQDNSAWCGPSSDVSHNNVPGSAWYTTTGGDGEYSVPAPSDPDIVYSDAQNGSISRLDLKNHLSDFIRPSVEGVEEMKPADLKYRYNWTAPIAVSRTNANEVFLGANVLFKSTDGGKNWTPISGDLTRNDKSKQEIAGGPVNHDISGAETYGTILSITLAATDPNVIWVGTDDGYVQVTRDGGKTWKNVTPHGAPAWARVYQVGVSPFNAGTAYVSFDGRMIDDSHAYVYRTSDYGANWQKITQGLPDDASVNVVREDSNQKGFLVAGTDTGLYYSPDNGDNWKPIKANFPTVPVWDVKFVKKNHDLAVATHGRGFFVLDDIRPLEQLTSEVEGGEFHLFTPSGGMMFHRWRSDEGQQAGYAAPNAPDGVIVDYYLKSEIKVSPAQKKEHESPVKIVITDERGNPVATEYGPSKEGVNRFVWNMRYEGPTPLNSMHMPASEYFNPNRGPMVMPGTYKISVTVNGQTQSQTATVVPDPNLHVDPAVFRAQTEAGLHARGEVTAMNEMLNRIDDIQKEMNSFAVTVQSSKDEELKTKYEPIVARGKELSKKLDAIKDVFIDPSVQMNVPEDSIHGLTRLQGQIAQLGFRGAGSYGQMPSPVIQAKAKELYGQLGEQLEKFNQLLKTDVAQYNKAAEQAGAPSVFAGTPVEVKAAKGM